ncbi:hypothetical protein L7F22_017980 [Adiantum nelumboides]|nr:hypothetical protein [Adiantum nelumboides]
MLLHYQDPVKLKTKKVVFEDTYCARDSGTLEQLKELTTRRKAVEDFLNGSNQLTPAIAREMAGGVSSPILQDLQKVERYIPLLQNLVVRVESSSSNARIPQWTSELKIRWTSVLTSSGPFGLAALKFYRVDNLRFELAMVFFLYGGLLRERALEVLSTDLVEAATLFRKAAGVFQHMAQEVLPPLQVLPASERIPEVTSTMATIMCLICLAEAQAVIVRKAEEKANSGSLLAKLHYGVVQFLEEANSLLQTHSSEFSDVSEKLKRFINTCMILHEARSQVYIANDYKKQESLGIAVGILRYAMNKFQGKSPGEESWKAVFRQEADVLGELLRKCENQNDFIWREKLPRLDELPILEGKKIVSQIEYHSSKLDRDFVFVM